MEGVMIQEKVRPFRSMSMRLTAFALLISILPVLFVSTLLLKRMESMMERELTQSYQWLIAEHIGNVEEKLAQYKAGMQYAAQDTMILDTLAETTGDAYQQGKIISEEIFKTVLLDNRPEIRNCMIYASTDSHRIYGSHVTMLQKADYDQWLKAGLQSGRGWFVSKAWDGRWMLSLVESLDQVNVRDFHTLNLGLIKLDIYLDQLFAPDVQKASVEQQKYQVILYDQGGNSLYVSGSGLKDVLDQWLERPKAVPDGALSTLGSYAVMKEDVSEYGLSLLFLFDNRELLRQQDQLRRAIYPIALMLAAVIVLVALTYSRRFSSRVGRLLEKFKIAGTGDLTRKGPVGGHDEIAILDRQFDQMLGQMDRMNQQNYVQKIEIREAQYLNLRLQINPHFLYNTLEIISSIAAVHQVFQICDLCEKLGDIFRYSLGKNEGKYTTVANEIRQTRSYNFIQQMRYRFEVFYSIEVDAEEVCMLRFLLQPIVENAVLHGLAKKNEQGTLEIFAGEEKGDLILRVSDDGAGMTEEELARLQKQLSEAPGAGGSVSHVGVWNIHQRIRLAHGEPYGVEVYSRPGQGSAFTLRLPLITKGMIADEKV
jgi:signal transduction histidine kinase